MVPGSARKWYTMGRIPDDDEDGPDTSMTDDHVKDVLEEKLRTLTVDGHRDLTNTILRKNLLINEVQMLLSEKRTSLSSMRTGIAINAIPLSLLVLMVTMSRYYEASDMLWEIATLSSFCILLLCIGTYMILRALKRLHDYDRIILEIKRKHRSLGKFIEEDSE
jgi:hypothetical protein